MAAPTLLLIVATRPMIYALVVWRWGPLASKLASRTLPQGHHLHAGRSALRPTQLPSRARWAAEMAPQSSHRLPNTETPVASRS